MRLRIREEHPWRAWHQYQHLYQWLLFPLVSMSIKAGSFAHSYADGTLLLHLGAYLPLLAVVALWPLQGT
tara:strand:+ start:573 stop:782 length:210 start_codon:yes stop_codon:yes gene_type:complete